MFRTESRMKVKKDSVRKIQFVSPDRPIIAGYREQRVKDGSDTTSITHDKQQIRQTIIPTPPPHSGLAVFQPEVLGKECKRIIVPWNEGRIRMGMCTCAEDESFYGLVELTSCKQQMYISIALTHLHSRTLKNLFHYLVHNFGSASSPHKPNECTGNRKRRRNLVDAYQYAPRSRVPHDHEGTRYVVGKAEDSKRTALNRI